MDMRLIDALPLETKIRTAQKVMKKHGDERAERALAYVLELIEDAPGIPIRPDEDKMRRKRYGAQRKVLLSDEELETLKREFPTDWETRIERLDEYIAQFGNKYKNHLATIRSWARRDVREIEERGAGQMESSFDAGEFLTLALEKSYGRGKA